MTNLFEQNGTIEYFHNREETERQNQLNFVNNLVSPEFIENEQKKGKINAFETLSNAKKWGYAVPYIGTGAEIGKDIRILNLQNKVREGYQLSSDEMDEYREFVLDIASQSVRGQTIPSMAWDGFLQSIPYMAEFGIGLATSGEGVGLASLGQTGGKLAVKKAIKDIGVKSIKDATKQQVKNQIAKNTAKTLVKDSTLGVAKFNIKYLPQQGVKRFGEVELDENLMVTPEGQVLLNEAERNPAMSVLKAIGLMQIETLSETAGYAFNLAEKSIGKFINNKLLKHLPEKFVSNLNKLSKQVTGLSTVKALQKYGWNGILEEFGEERVSDFLQTTFDLDGQEGYSFEQFVQAMFPPKEQAIAEILSFALMGGTGTGIKKGVDFSRYKSIAKDIQEKSKNEDGTYNTEKIKRLIKRNNPNITSENLEKTVSAITKGITKTEDYSVDDFLLDCGVFRVHARKSNTDERLTKILQDGGVKEEDIENFLDYASLDDKAQLLKMHDEAQTKKQDYSALKSELVNAGHSEEQAELEVQSLDRIDEILMDKYNAEGEAENLIKKRNLKVQAIQNEVQQQKEQEYVQNSELKQKEIYHFKPSELKTNAKLFQYKENSDEEGKTDRMNGVEEWSAQDSGIVIVWEAKDGQRYIADGHQRLGLAKRLNDENIRLDGVLYREVDGYTPEDVRMIAAKKNIAEGSGTPIDTAKILRELGGADNYPASLPRKGAMYEYGIALSRLGDEAFEKVINGYVTPAQGAMIANIIRNDHTKQSLAIDIVAQEGIETLSETELMARQVLSTPTETVEQTNLFGTQQILQSSAVEKIKIIDGAIKELKKTKNRMAFLGNNSKAIEKNGNKLNKANNEQLKKSAEIALEVVKKQAFYEGAISDKANELAQKERNGEISHNEATRQFADFVMSDDILDIIFNRKNDSVNEESNNSENNIKKNNESIPEEVDNSQTSLFNLQTQQEKLNNELPEFTPEEKPEAIDKYEDFGEKIEGAKKDIWVSYQSSLEKPMTEDFEKISLSKDFPEPNYEGLIREGVDVNILATIKALRDSIPAKPRGRRGTYKRDEYINVLKFVRELASDLISGRKNLADIEDALNKATTIKEQVQLYIELGYPAFKNAKGWKIKSGIFSTANGEKLPEPKRMFYAYNISNNLRKSTDAFDTREELFDYMREKFSTEPEQEERKTKLDIYQMRSTGEIIIGKKVGTNKYIDLKGGFTSAKEARTYYKENEKELLEKLKKLKETPETRGSANKERVGEDYREGMNVTPEKFANEFGFRGVQFGNYVEQSKRVDDINEAYDALLDLANLLDVPSRAISLNGSLGIAFGARGNGGKFSAAAHYEPAQVVINLTKKKGAGSLAHEWWHALDNFFGKLEGSVDGYISERYSSKEIRKEIFDAYKGIVDVLKKNMFERSKKIDDTRSKDYWSTTREMTARGFEAYIIAKSKMKGFTNDYLANILTEQEYRDIELYPYPYESEMQEVIEAYDKLFSLLKTKETEKGITFYQSAKEPNGTEEEPRAKIEFGSNGTIISLAEGHDASSFMHELGHLYLHDLQELAKTNKRAEKDLKEIYDVLDFDEKNATPEDVKEMHERFARSFEAYLLNGKAPTARLKTIFERFKEFLKDVYESLSDLNVNFSDEIQECFDRLFTTDEEYEKEVLPLYKQNEELAESINQQETLSYKIKNNINAITEAWKSFYDTVIIPIDTQLGRISPELKKLLRKHTFDMTYQAKKDCDKITPFLKKVQEIKKDKKTIEYNGTVFNAYNLLSYALNNRDSYMVNKVVKSLGISKEFEQVRELLDQIHEETESVGLSVGYLESYYPRMVKTDKTDEFIELFEKMTREEEIDLKEQLLELDEAEYSNVKRTIRENDVHGLWNNADKAKLINTAIRGFGKNNILLSRIGQLKFERIIDKLTPEQQQFYEPIEKALSNYVIGARKNIEERKFFGAENKEVSKLRASIKRKRETLREVKMRTPAQAKWKEINRLKYELAPIEIKLETISGELKNNLEDIKKIKDEERKAKVQGFIDNQKEMIKTLNERAERLKSQLQWTEENNNLKVKNVVVKRLNDELKELNKEIESILGDIDHVEDSIGRLIADLAEKGIIHVKDERVVRDLLVSRFNTIKLEKVATTLRDASTIVTLNDITNAVTQITDLTFSAFKFGLFNTFKGMRGVEGLTRESLGIKNIAEEFRGSGSISNWLNKQLKLIGLDLIDGFAKNVAINASVLTAREKARKDNKKFNEKLNFLFGEKEAKQVKQDLIDGKITDEIIFLAFNDLADIQPISTDQMTRGYQSGFKPLYVLKTYSIKALDIIRNECFSKISSGIKDLQEDKTKGLEQIREGITNLIKLQTFMWLFGLPQDLIKDLIANKDFDIPEHVIDNLLIFGIFNRFLINKVADNPANIYLENVKLPIIQAIGDLWTGIQQVKKGKKEVKDLYVWSRVPFIGKLYYNWLGGRKEKRIKLN